MHGRTGHLSLSSVPVSGFEMPETHLDQGHVQDLVCRRRRTAAHRRWPITSSFIVEEQGELERFSRSGELASQIIGFRRSTENRRIVETSAAECLGNAQRMGNHEPFFMMPCIRSFCVSRRLLEHQVSLELGRPSYRLARINYLQSLRGRASLSEYIAKDESSHDEVLKDGDRDHELEQKWIEARPHGTIMDWRHVRPRPARWSLSWLSLWE